LKIDDFNLPHRHMAPQLGVTALEFRLDLWPQKVGVSGLPYTALVA